MRKIIILIGVACTFTLCSWNHLSYSVFDGFTMGTTYHIIHDNDADADVAAGIDSVLQLIDNSLSVYNPQSIVSKINRNEKATIDSLFSAVFVKSKEVYEKTDGAFDVSASPLFNVWGFGFKNKEAVTPEKIDSLKQFCGMERVMLKGRQVVKTDPRATLNFNAIAKGFGVDLVAHYLEQSGVKNYLVEIGGEIRCKGRNRKGDLWSVGIDKPVDGNVFPGENLQTVLHFTGKSLATSGNYRSYYEKDGKKYAHTINPATGYPVLHNLLSATVFAPDCMTADAYATAFMVVGLDRAKALLKTHPELSVYLLYEEAGVLKVFCSDDVQKMMR